MKNQAHPILHDIPIGIDATDQRHETDSMGGTDVPADRHWGAQTERSLVSGRHTNGCIKRRSNQARSEQLYGTVAATYGMATHPDTSGEIR